MKKNILGFFIAAGIVLGSCNENDAPATAKVQLEMKATTSLSRISASGRGMATGLIFREILVGVTELEFETLEENELEEENDTQDGENHDGENENEEIEFEGPFVVDLIQGTSTPDFGVADLLPGLYEEMEIEIGPVLDGGISLFIALDLPREGADALKIEYSNSNEMEIEIERDAGFHVDGGALNQFLILFDLDSLFLSIDFNQAVVDADGIIRINASSNAYLAALIEANLTHALEAGEDEDGDDEIDED
ncbi:MAG: hypothetical protein ABIR06_08415 [Cyclobacteriaceae bacterium]